MVYPEDAAPLSAEEKKIAEELEGYIDSFILKNKGHSEYTIGLMNIVINGLQFTGIKRRIILFVADRYKQHGWKIGFIESDKIIDPKFPKLIKSLVLEIPSQKEQIREELKDATDNT